MAVNAWTAGAIALDVLAAGRDTAAAIERRRDTRWRELLQAACRSALYRPLIATRSGRLPALHELHELPVMRKSELMHRFNDWVTEPALRLDDACRFIADPKAIGRPWHAGCTVWESSGSTGEPGIFVQDAHAMAVYDALEGLRRPPLQPWRRLWDPLYLAERIAFVGATTGHFASTVSVERLRREQPALSHGLRGFSFLTPTPELVAQLNAFQPTILATYPTAAWMLALQAQAGALTLKLSEVWTGGETLTPLMRQRVSGAFGCPVANSYGASEFLAMANECRAGRLHLNSDWLILESVDAQGRAVPPGEPGHTCLLTNLANHVQPLIRYDLGDRVTLQATPCACGSSLPVIEVEGRTDDAIVLRGPRRKPVYLLPLAITTVLEEHAGVFDFQLVQRGDTALELRVAGSADDAQRATAALRAFLALQGLPRAHLDTLTVQACCRGRSGKVPRIVSGRVLS